MIRSTCGTTSGRMNCTPARLTLTNGRSVRKLLPHRQLPARLLEHHPAYRNDQAGLLRQRNEGVWVKKTALGMLPSDQRLEALDDPSTRLTIG